jgi:hypothetical protein
LSVLTTATGFSRDFTQNPAAPLFFRRDAGIYSNSDLCLIPNAPGACQAYALGNQVIPESCMKINEKLGYK